MSQQKNNKIDYAIIRSKRNTADIVIERDGQVYVRAPEWSSDDHIDSIIEAKKYWIYRNLAEWRELNRHRVQREYKNGESFLYLGRSYRLRLVDQQAQDLQLRNGRFMLRRDLLQSNDLTAAKSAFINYYSQRGLERVTERVSYYAPKVGVSFRNVNIRDLGYRWATCTKTGRLSFHWKCMMAPQTIIDYIVVHELCHLHHRDHTTAFWNEVDKVIPNYRERKDWLRINGVNLDI